MKAGAIVRICIWSLVAIVLSVILILGLLLGGIDLSVWSPELGGYHFSDPQTYSVGGTTMDTDAVHSIDVEWIAGSIRITATKEEKITVRESATTDPDDALRWRVQNGELQIKYCKPRLFGTTISKELEILLPASMMPAGEGLHKISVENVSSSIEIEELSARELNIESVSGNILISDSSVEFLELENVSGSIRIERCAIGDIDAATVSGSITANGEIRAIEMSGVSATLDISSYICPRELSMETVSGRVQLTIPEDSGFILNMESLSGQVHAPDFPMSRSGNGTYLYGNGDARFEFESVSGRIDIQKISPRE